jgi:hypothetical protein
MSPIADSTMKTTWKEAAGSSSASLAPLRAQRFPARAGSFYGPQRRFAPLPQSFRSRRQTGRVANIAKTALTILNGPEGSMTHSRL